MAFHCKGICRELAQDEDLGYRVTKKPCLRLGYASGIKSCSVCEKGFISYSGVRCPCCENVLRIPECNLRSRRKIYIDSSDIEEVVVLA